MNPEIANKIEDIKNDRIHGAGWLSREAINILNLAIDRSQAITTKGIVDEIQTVAAELSKARPSMSPIANFAHEFMRLLAEHSRMENTLENLKADALSMSQELVIRSEEATAQAAEFCSVIIRDKDTIMTCSYSDTVCRALELAKDRGAKFQVIIAESVFQDNAYGEMALQRLKKSKILTRMITDQQIELNLSRASKAMTGADSIMTDGSLINGIPTLRLAQSAARANVPFYCVSQTAKFDMLGQAAKTTELEAGLDRIPSNLITGIITEKGTMNPTVITAYVEMARLPA